MKGRLYTILAIAFVSTMSGCQLVGDIFKAGYYVGVFVVLAVVILVVGIYFYLRRR